MTDISGLSAATVNPANETPLLDKNILFAIRRLGEGRATKSMSTSTHIHREVQNRPVIDSTRHLISLINLF